MIPGLARSGYATVTDCEFLVSETVYQDSLVLYAYSLTKITDLVMCFTAVTE